MVPCGDKIKSPEAPYIIKIYCHDTDKEAMTITRQQWQQQLQRHSNNKDNSTQAKLQSA